MHENNSHKSKIITLKLETTKVLNNSDKTDFIKYIDENNFNCIKRKSKIKELDKFLLIYMASNTENLNAIFKINKFDGNIILFCDRTNNWYHDIMSKIIKKINKYIIKLKCTNIILLGQSSGGYASLYISSKINNCICLAFNPQTFQKNNKLLIHDKIYHLKEPTHLLDLKIILNKSNTNTKRYIFVGKSECDSMYNKNGYFWMDSLFAGYMLDAINTQLLIVPKNMHPLFQVMDFISLYKIIILYFNTLFDDLDKGGKLLNKNIIYYDKH